MAIGGAGSSYLQKNIENCARKVPKRDPALKKGAQDYARQQKTQQNIITARRAPRDGLQKQREETTDDNQS